MNIAVYVIVGLLAGLLVPSLALWLLQRLARELGAMDFVWVTSPLPLDDHAKLRVQIADVARNEVTQLLMDGGWTLQFVSILPRVCATGLMAACLYEIDVPRERQTIVDDRVNGEVATKDKGRPSEVTASLKALGYKT